MPTYEFRCPNGHEFERFYRKISDAAAELPCPECGAAAGRQLSAGAGLLFKGSGFYLTDYGKNAHRKPGPAAGAGSAGVGGDKAGEGKSGAGTAGETKGSDAKPAETKASTAKPAEQSTAPSKPSGGSGDKS